MNLIRAIVVGVGLLCAMTAFSQDFRPPAVPLITHDPYFSVWSNTDKPTDGPTVHWTGSPQPLTCLVKLGGKFYRLMGDQPANLPAANQTGLRITATQTVYEFQEDGYRIYLSFQSPLIPSDLKAYSIPLTQIYVTIAGPAGREPDFNVLFAVSGMLAVNKGDQIVTTGQIKGKEWSAIKVGTVDQPVLQKRGDDLRIDWGHLYFVGGEAVGRFDDLVHDFMSKGQLSSYKKMTGRADEVTLAATLGLGGDRGTYSGSVAIAYDDDRCIQYFGQNLRPYWHKFFPTIKDAIDYAYGRGGYPLAKEASDFDKRLNEALEQAGGPAYATIGALAFRQSLAAQKLAMDESGAPLLFPKENFSNGCISTVDVIYPAAPLLLLTSPTLTRASLVPVLQYAASPRWNFTFAPHDLGTYPKANGQVYGGGERTEDDQMPVEESGNMIILLAALAKVEGSASLAKAYWPQVSKWANYLEEKGFDPDNQLCTDDFAGHLAHNVNLSAKAIVAIGAYSQLCDMLGHKQEAAKSRKLAEEFSARWQKEAFDGDHYRLAFDKPGTWSQKYNLVWDRILGLNLFPESVFRTEVDYYKTKLNAYGLPLDNRRDYTKLDWITWTASLTGNKDDFEALVNPIAKFLNDTPDRVPMTDWFETKEPKKSGFQARSVVGGVFIKMLEDPDLWHKLADQDKMHVTHWAPLPTPPEYKIVVPSGAEVKVNWRYTIAQPSSNWFKEDFDDSSWLTGFGGFGTAGTPGISLGTTWNTDDIWIRRTFDLTSTNSIDLKIHHDEDAEVYVNGHLIAHLPGWQASYEVVALTATARKAFRKGKNTLAIHCHQTTGGQFIDAGFVRLVSKR